MLLLPMFEVPVEPPLLDEFLYLVLELDTLLGVVAMVVLQ